MHLRPARAQDEDGLVAFFDRLSEDSPRSRTFPLPASSQPEVSRLVRANGVDDFVLIGELGGRPCAVASYSRDPHDPARAEVAFAIADRFQGRGIGTRLLEALAETGREHGLQHFHADVLGANDRMMRVFCDSGFEIENRVDSGVCHVVLSLARTARTDVKAAERSETAATASMRHFFHPRSVVVIGANRDRGKIGSEVLHNIIAGGFTGTVAAVHPSASTIDGVPAYPTVRDVPVDIDLAVICVPADRVLAVVDDCVGKGVGALVVISAGFGESGAEGRAREAALLARIRDAGIRLVGPNCMGLINTAPDVRLNATFAPVAPLSGRVAMSTQSGALGLAILDYARQLNIGLSTFVSVGNKTDVSSNDLLQYWANDPQTDVIVLYLESFGNPRKFSQIARRVARHKPIVAVKSGRSAAGARAASSHTGALASRDVIVDALFRQAGVIRTGTLEELFDVATLLAHQPIPRGRRVAIVTNAGGPGILAADACEAQGLQLPALSAASVAELKSFLPPAAAVGNPVDMMASATAEHYERTIATVLRDDGVDSVLVIFIPPLVTKSEDVAEAVRRAANGHQDKTIAAIFMSASGAPSLLAPIPCFRFPEAAAASLARTAERGEWLRVPEGRVPEFRDLDRPAARSVVDGVLARGGGWLTPAESTALLSAVRVPVAVSDVAETEAAAVALATRIGFPLVIKVTGPDILHKSDVGGVVVGVKDVEAVRDTWRDLAARLGDRMTGVMVQELVTGGVEMLVGATDEATFGLVLACAMGGTLAEVLADSQFRLHPLTERDAASMIDQLRSVRLLRGYRGAPVADESALRDVLLRVSALIDICPEIRELDINPLRVMPQGARALDVRVRVERPAPPPVTRGVS